MTMFLHFGVNTFTGREWGDGSEDPTIFDPNELDARQWARVAKETGFKYLILTAKRHDGFCLWPSAHTDHSVKRASWKGGTGDVCREFADACRAEGLRVGFYLSPWDRHEQTYGDSDAYNDYFRRQLTELLANYGDVSEVWFDGACGEGPNGKRQEYDWQSYYDLIRRLHPEALIAICGPNVRWVGNEDGYARETEWSVQDPVPERHPFADGPVWYPAECDVSIRPGWFWRESENDRVKSLDHLLDIYFKSVGRNSVLLLNVPPDCRGLIAEPDVEQLYEFRRALDRIFETNLASQRPTEATSQCEGRPPRHLVDGNPETFWSPTVAPASVEIDLSGPTTFNVSMAQEHIAEGQRVEAYRLEARVDGAWQTVVNGATVGHKKLERFAPIAADRVRLTILKSRDVPLLRSFGLYCAPDVPTPREDG